MTMTILQATLARLTETAADGWWDGLSAEQKKQYIKDHPNSKYAKQGDKGGRKPAVKKAADKTPAKSTGKTVDERKKASDAAKKEAEAKRTSAKSPKAAAEQAHADLTKATEAINELKRKHAPEFKKYNDLLKAYHGATGAKQTKLDAQLAEMDKLPHIKKALKLSDQKRAAKQALDEAKKSGVAPAKPAAKKAPSTSLKDADKIREERNRQAYDFAKSLAPEKRDAARDGLQKEANDQLAKMSKAKGDAKMRIADELVDIQAKLTALKKLDSNAPPAAATRKSDKDALTTFKDAKVRSDELDKGYSDASKTLKDFVASKGGPHANGLTPDKIKNTKEYKDLKRDVDAWFQRTRAFNSEYTKKFAKDIRADRERRLAAKRRTFGHDPAPRKSKVGPV